MGYASVCPAYIFITAEPCWYSTLGRTKNMRPCAGSGKTWPHTRCREGRFPEVKKLLFLKGEVPKGPRGHWVTSPGRHIEQRAVCSRRPHQQPCANTGGRDTAVFNPELCTCLQVFMPVQLCSRHFHWLDPHLWLKVCSEISWWL